MPALLTRMTMILLSSSLTKSILLNEKVSILGRMIMEAFCDIFERTTDALLRVSLMSPEPWETWRVIMVFSRRGRFFTSMMPLR
ncbi:MAG: hypothetical protein BWX71_02043 [Deltaproteobacteria bacterium ADurb.Bin072]|nr:MAG: hypothetical protein BWX71_02043 [Deltaproteobacteria bacterium ADurb.Bin072]